MMNDMNGCGETPASPKGASSEEELATDWFPKAPKRSGLTGAFYSAPTFAVGVGIGCLILLSLAVWAANHLAIGIYHLFFH
jgi:hypothetical protein